MKETSWTSKKKFNTHFFVSPSGVTHRHLIRTLVGPSFVIVDTGDWKLQAQSLEIPLKAVASFVTTLRPHNPKQLLLEHRRERQ